MDKIYEGKETFKKLEKRVYKLFEIDQSITEVRVFQRAFKDLGIMIVFGKDDYELKLGTRKSEVLKNEIPESVKKKGYQWEALSDEAAGEIITDAINKYISIDVINETNRKARHVSRKLEDKIDKLIEKL